MVRRLIGIAGVTLAAMLALTVDATAAPATGKSVLMPFTLDPAVCPQVTSTVTGTGTEQVFTHSSVNGKGVTHMVVITTARGTATDTVGGRYRFNYLNNTKTVIQPGGLPQDILIRDHFNLVGNGSNQVHTSFVVRVHVFGPGQTDFTVEVVKTHGDPDHCDPI
jgi:hypothetical protein